MALPSGWLGQADNFLGIDEPWCHPDQAGVYNVINKKSSKYKYRKYKYFEKK